MVSPTLVRDYIFLAAGCASVGIVITFAVLAASQRLGISLDENLWLLAVPVVLSISLNILLIELYRKRRRK